MPAKKKPCFFTIGHSNRPLEDFRSLLESSKIERVVDVRTVPRSRSNPQYDRTMLPRALAKAHIEYAHIAALGGLRGKQRDIAPATNAFWENASFHNYADYAMTAGFREGLSELRSLGRGDRCAVMCAEALWWRCHRRIIADYLLHTGAEVLHIMSRDHVESAQITDAARPGPGGTLVYPAQ
jgi:uncharacterized protein (DUF488 family)